MQFKMILKMTFSAVALAGLALTGSQAGLAQGGGFTIAPVVRRGDAVSDGGRFFDCGSCEGRVIGQHALNNRGEVAIGADVAAGSCSGGRFVVRSGGSVRLADFCQLTEFGQFNLLGPVNLNDEGQAVMHTGVIVNQRFVQMLLLHSEGELRQVVKEGDLTPAGVVIDGCGFGQPAINNRGEVAFHACARSAGLGFGDGVFVWEDGSLREVVVHGQASPVGGEFQLNFFPPPPVQINDAGEVLFNADVRFDIQTQRTGLFLATASGVKKILFDTEPLPTGGVVMRQTFAGGDLNNRSEVTFSVRLTGGSGDSGIFAYTGGAIEKIMAEGDATPLGGRFSSLLDPQLREEFPIPRINDNGAVAFKVRVTGGSAPSAIFLASASAMVKVAAIGDRLPGGGKIKEITSFALNDFGEVAFYAEAKNGKKGVYLAAPRTPQISKVKVKQRTGGLELIVTGEGMIVNDTVVEINGVALEAMSYPEGYRENGGTTRRVVSRDGRLAELLPAGQAVEVTVFNRLTNLRSAARVVRR